MNTCMLCGMSNPSRTHPTSRRCVAKQRIAQLKAAGYAPIPYRRWTRAFKAEGVRVVHAPVTQDRTGNWVEKTFLDGFVAQRRVQAFRKLPFKLQVADYVFWNRLNAILLAADQAP